MRVIYYVIRRVRALFVLTKDDFHLINYEPHDRIKAPLSN